jgi:hypothetical protein
MNFNLFNPITHYETPASQLQGFIAELFHELPTELHDVVRHSKMLALVCMLIISTIFNNSEQL